MEELLMMDFQDYIDKALETENVQEQIKWLERALENDPKRAEDVLRVAKGLQSLSARTSGIEYIKELAKRARRPRSKAKKKNGS